MTSYLSLKAKGDDEWHTAKLPDFAASRRVLLSILEFGGKMAIRKGAAQLAPGILAIDADALGATIEMAEGYTKLLTLSPDTREFYHDLGWLECQISIDPPANTTLGGVDDL